MSCMCLLFSLRRHERTRVTWFLGHTTVSCRYTSVLTMPASWFNHNLIYDCLYNVEISSSALNSNSISEQCFAKMEVNTYQEMAVKRLSYGCAYGNSSEPGASTSRSFCDGNLNFIKHSSTSIIACERQGHFSLFLLTERGHYPSKHQTYPMPR
jgi:hypothetical protein